MIMISKYETTILITLTYYIATNAKKILVQYNIYCCVILQYK